MLEKDGGGPSAIQNQADVKDSPYFKRVDVYNMKSGGSLLVLEKYKTHQQHTEYTCGPAAAFTVVEFFWGKSPDTEMEIAKVMETHPAGIKDPGTNTRGMSRYFEQKGWTVKNSLKNGSPETYEKFLDFVDDNLKRGIPIMVENVDWGGHWRVIIGHDSMGDKYGENDVLILADPYDTSDHHQDGYNIVSAERFYHMWFDAQLFREKEKNRQWLTAVPPGYKGLNKN
ncbi:MAG: C39 family peptidase [Acidaminococcaceae bacterium]|nr:C39 family peptidase [Acidaminococcaceae bacterium]